jgi:hypothetical protein
MIQNGRVGIKILFTRNTTMNLGILLLLNQRLKSLLQMIPCDMYTTMLLLYEGKITIKWTLNLNNWILRMS